METIKDSYKKLHGLAQIGKGLDHKDSKTIEWAENLITEQTATQQQTIAHLEEELKVSENKLWEVTEERNAHEQTIERLREGISELKRIDEGSESQEEFLGAIRSLYEILNTTEPELDEQQLDHKRIEELTERTAKDRCILHGSLQGRRYGNPRQPF